MRVAGHLFVHFTELLFLCSLFLLLLRDQFALITATRARKCRNGLNTLRRGPGIKKAVAFFNNHTRVNAVDSAIIVFSERTGDKEIP